MANFEEVDDEIRFDDILEHNDKVVVDFGAAWCGPCNRFAPHFTSASEKSDAKFVSIDVDEAPWAAKRFNILGIPNVKFFREGQVETELLSRTAPKLLSEIPE